MIEQIKILTRDLILILLDGTQKVPDPQSRPKTEYATNKVSYQSDVLKYPFADERWTATDLYWSVPIIWSARLTSTRGNAASSAGLRWETGVRLNLESSESVESIIKELNFWISMWASLISNSYV